MNELNLNNLRDKVHANAILFRCNSTEWYFTNMEEYIDESMIVTHWMPIPE